MCNYRHISNGDNYNSKSIALNSKIALVPNLQADDQRRMALDIQFGIQVYLERGLNWFDSNTSHLRRMTFLRLCVVTYKNIRLAFSNTSVHL